jgi:gas vesicle protein
MPTPQEPSSGLGGGSGSTKDVAKEQAGDVTDTAKQAGGQVVDEAKQQAANVAGEVVDQTQNLLHQGLAEIRNRTGEQQQRLADTVHSWAKELGAMASSSSESGPMTNLVQDASRRSGELAHWLQEHEPRDILHELRSFARRRPGTFLLAAATAGVLAGRLTRGFSANRSSGSSSSPAGDLSGGTGAPALPQGTPDVSPGLQQAPRDPATTGVWPPTTGTPTTGTATTGTTGIGTTGPGSNVEGPGATAPGIGGAGTSYSDPAGGQLPSEAVEPTRSIPPTTPER